MSKPKQTILLFQILIILFSFCACNAFDESSAEAFDVISPVNKLPDDWPAGLEYVTPPPSCTPTTEEKLPVTEEPAYEKAGNASFLSAEVPYIEKITNPDQHIFSGPGYDYPYVTSVREAGSYTIVEEQLDSDGLLWGKLKSGLGWVDLSSVRQMIKPAVIVNRYSDVELPTGIVHTAGFGTEEYRIPVAVAVFENYRDLCLYNLVLSNDGYSLGEKIFSFQPFPAGDSIVADLSFDGDFTAYGIVLEEESGETATYIFYESLRNGELILQQADIG